MTFVENISRVMDSATPAQIRTGAAWYPTAHNLASEMHESLTIAAGIVATYSIQNPWGRNLRCAAETLRTGKPVPHTGMVMGKAQAILDGADPFTVLGPKTSRFYLSIVDPTTPEIVVDRHARDIAFGAPVFKNPGIGVRLYAEIAEAYRTVAATYGMMDSETQAITWVAWREAKGLSWAD